MKSSAVIFFTVILCTFLSGGSTQQVVSEADAICDGITYGIVAHPTDCTRFYVCVLSRGTLGQCAPYFVFNPQVSFCVHRGQYQCPSDLTTTTTTTSAPTQSVPETTPTSTTASSACPETPWESHFCRDHSSDLIQNPFNCTQYINCEANPVRNDICPPDHVFNLAYQDCFPRNGLTCEMQPLDTEFCSQRAPGNYPHPYLCNRFVTCFRGEARLETCPPYYIFDQALLRCVRGDIIKCSSLLG
ncbi:uncharacterized protein LOC129749593 [Uranotaenia lowii]|uniref:uncharacterized protein LOC129749593 n=1 Tax=Uranotaenia lowii TaxID=190385 RepID=UPI002479DA42|nr:uncharacterized protein LOC129749593 [Uranotaenia lowii]